jgi:hypothetical protein
VTLVQREPDSRFAIYEVALRRRPMLNYYLERFSKRLRVKGTYLAADESDRDALPRIEAKTAKRDYVIFAFPYVKASNFPVLMQWLQSKHEVMFSQLAPNGRGYVVLKTPRAKSGDKTRRE